MPSDSTSFATDANVSGIAVSLVSVYQPEPTSPIDIDTSRRTNLLSTYCPVAGSDIPARRREVAAIGPQDIIWEPNVCSTPLPPRVHATWARDTCINFTYDQLENQNAASEQYSDELYRLKIKKFALSIGFVIKQFLFWIKRAPFQLLSFFTVTTSILQIAW